MLGSFKVGAAVGFALAGAWWAWEAATTPPPRPAERPALVASAATAAPQASAEPPPPQASAAPPPRASAAPPAPGSATARNAQPPREALPSDPPATSAAPVEPAPAASSSPPPASSAEIARQERLERMREETELTRAARAALRSGNAPEALRLLGEIQAKFGGRGMLSQEREALAIEALARTGQGDQARARAQAFLSAYPSSPFAQDVQGFAR